ncbi:LIM domain transcription factor LMO4-B [Tachysurus ichikawai]
MQISPRKQSTGFCFSCATCRNRLVPGDRFHYVNGTIFCEHDRPNATLLSAHLQGNPVLPDQKVRLLRARDHRPHFIPAFLLCPLNLWPREILQLSNACTSTLASRKVKSTSVLHSTAPPEKLVLPSFSF